MPRVRKLSTVNRNEYQMSSPVTMPYRAYEARNNAAARNEAAATVAAALRQPVRGAIRPTAAGRTAHTVVSFAQKASAIQAVNAANSLRPAACPCAAPSCRPSRTLTRRTPARSGP